MLSEHESRYEVGELYSFSHCVNETKWCDIKRDVRITGIERLYQASQGSE